MEQFFTPELIEMLERLLVAMLLGMVLGAERRIIAGKKAGMRTYALVSMGSALFVIVSVLVTKEFTGLTNFDPLRIASQIVVGLGFLGAGIIIFRGSGLTGLTTAAGIWVAGAIGIATGFGFYTLAVFATILTLIIFTVLWFIERWVLKAYKGISDEEEEEL